MDYRDIIYMLDKDIVVQERRGKHEQICHMTNLLQEIASNAEVAVTKAEQVLQLVKGKNGRKEEEDFWKKILLNGKEVEGKITSVKNKCERLLQMFDDGLGPGRKEQATRRESKKNQKKGIKRTLKPESTTSIVHFFKKHAAYIAHLSCGERHSYLKHSYSYRMPKQNIATA